MVFGCSHLYLQVLRLMHRLDNTTKQVATSSNSVNILTWANYTLTSRSGNQCSKFENCLRPRGRIRAASPARGRTGVNIVNWTVPSACRESGRIATTLLDVLP